MNIIDAKEADLDDFVVSLLRYSKSYHYKIRPINRIMKTKTEDKYTCFESLFKMHYARLYYYACNIINDTISAEDIVEDVFSSLWEKYDSIQSEASVLPLLYSSTRSRCIDFLRHQEVKGRFQESFSQYFVDHFDTVEDSVVHKERIEVVMSAINALSPQARKTFEACFLKGKRYKEVGEELDISVNTVKTHISRALLFIRKRVAELGIDD